MSSKIILPILAALILLATCFLSAPLAFAQNWPLRTVKLIVPLGPASGADVTARVMAEQLAKRWRQAVVVENRPGADGIVGLAAFLGNADDHTLLFAPTGTFVAHPFLHDKLAYDPTRLVPVARVTSTLIAITVPASADIDALAQLAGRVRSQPDRLHWASVTGATDLVFSGFLASAGLHMIRVPYRDGVQALNDLGEGRIDVLLSALATVLPQVASGRIKILALTNSTRAPSLPQVPTALESGYSALRYDGLVGLFATGGMQGDTRERIAADVRAVMADPTIAARVAATGQIVVAGTPAELAASIAEQRAAFAAMAQSLGQAPKP